MDLRSTIDLRGKRVTVMGLGRFGGGAGAVRFLSSRGARITLTDLLDEAALSASLAQIADCGVETYRLGGHREEDFVETDLVIVNPAVPRSNPYLQLARDAGIPLSSEMALFWQFHPGRTAGVTGSNGKSTTTTLLHSILTAARIPSFLGGNIGGSLLPQVDQFQPTDWAVLELSSFQLDDLDRLPASPNLAIVTNFSPNHLDWHGDLASYRRAKQGILRWQTPDDCAILNQDDEDVSSWPSFGRTYWFGSHDLGREGVFERNDQCVLRMDGREKTFPLGDWLSLPGRHNRQNAMAATCAALLAGADLAAVSRGLKAYKPLPHRLELVGEVAGRRFYNDSLATTPESAIVAMESFSEPVVLLAGGYDKQIDLSPMVAVMAQRAKAAALMGQTAELIACLLESHAESDGIAVAECTSFEEAFYWAVEQSNPGDVVLLSPGCASYDWFANYAQRGEQFRQLVRSLETRCQAR